MWKKEVQVVIIKKHLNFLKGRHNIYNKNPFEKNLFASLKRLYLHTWKYHCIFFEIFFSFDSICFYFDFLVTLEKVYHVRTSYFKSFFLNTYIKSTQFFVHFIMYLCVYFLFGICLQNNPLQFYKNEFIRYCLRIICLYVYKHKLNDI